MAAKRIREPASVPLIVLTDAETGRKIAINTGWMRSFSEGEPHGTVLRFTNGESLTVKEDFWTVASAFEFHG